MGSEMGEVMLDSTLEVVERLRPVATEAGMDLPTLALAWTLQRPEVASTLVGVSRPAQVHANAASSGIELGTDLLAAVDEAIGDAAVTGPAVSKFTETGVLRRGETTCSATPG
jgi:aryl-alcohol dehydrogenase-like predicted oxidoreductase